VTPETNNELSAAREEVQKQFGGEFEKKASDALCLAVYRSSHHAVPAGFHAPAFGLESFAPSTAAVPYATVVEFDESAGAPDLLDKRWEGESEARRAIEILEAAAPKGVPNQMLRQLRVARARNESLKIMSTVYDEIERRSGGILRTAPDPGLGLPVTALVTQQCWLNRTIRTLVPPEGLADIASASEVIHLDLPRRIMPDSYPSNQCAVGLPAFIDRGVRTGAGVTVAVIDGEVDRRHPGLRERVFHRVNYTEEPWSNPSDHGTAVAGIIGADDPEYRGFAPGVIFFNYKVMTPDRMLNGDSFQGAVAIEQALEDGADIANCSWGAGEIGEVASRAARAVDYAWGLGMPVVKSAGNRGPDWSTMTAPAEAAGIIVVGGTDVAGREVQDYSSRGPAGVVRRGPDVVAPGGSATHRVISCQVGGGFGPTDRAGTSFAAPHVSGILALYLEADPQLDPDQLRERVKRDAKPLEGWGPEAQGAGLAYIT
jgi:serine protease AprX